MFIANFSMEQIQKGLHFDASFVPIMLIQIKDPDIGQFIKSPQQNLFKKVIQLEFFDSEEELVGSISDEQAKNIADVLNLALENKWNVIVHCHAGICRSGAIAEVGKIIGFDIPDGINHRIPNRLVFNKVRKALGILNSWE